MPGWAWNDKLISGECFDRQLVRPRILLRTSPSNHVNHSIALHSLGPEAAAAFGIVSVTPSDFWGLTLTSCSASLRHAAPPGVYVSLAPGDPTLWNGVIFVRSGELHFS